MSVFISERLISTGVLYSFCACLPWVKVLITSTCACLYVIYLIPRLMHHSVQFDFSVTADHLWSLSLTWPCPKLLPPTIHTTCHTHTHLSLTHNSLLVLALWTCALSFSLYSDSLTLGCLIKGFLLKPYCDTL